MRLNFTCCWWFALVLTLMLPGVSPAQKPKSLVLAPGVKAIVTRGAVHGSAGATYALRLTKGQQVRVTLHGSSSSTYFNIFAPGVVPGSGEALFSGAEKGTFAEIVAQQSGDYLVQVFLMRNVARRGVTSNYSLTVARAPAPQ